MKTKAFDQNLLDKHDKGAREELKLIIMNVVGSDKIAKFEENIGEQNKTFNDGFWDLKVILNDGRVYKIEVEEKDASLWGWRKKKYPFAFSTMHLPFRKKKNASDYFVVMSMAHNFAFVVRRNKAHTAPVVEIDTCLQKNDGFFDIPVEEGFFLEKKDGVWCKIKK